MVPYDAVADLILRRVATLIKNGDQSQLRGLDGFPVALYITDSNGVITYFNPACVDFAGREPTVLRDRWCVTWKLYTDDGEFLPHDECPMAVAIRTRQEVRGITAVAERPDGTRINFLPFPTPVIDDAGELLSAINMLIDITEYRQARHTSDEQEDRVRSALSMFSVDEIRDLVQEIEISVGPKRPGTLH